MRVSRGDIVLIDFPFSSGSGGKVRPAVIVQKDMNNRRLNNTIVAMISSRVDRARTEPTQLLVDLASPIGQQSGLLHDSAINCASIFTVERSLIRKVIGSLPADAMTGMDTCLKTSLGLQ